MTTSISTSSPVRALPWWTFLLTGAAWIVVAWIVLGFNEQSIVAIATLAGVVILVAAAFELVLLVYAPSWKWLHGLLGVLFVITGIFALINPGRTVFWLAAFIGWYLLFKGIADIMLAFLTKAENDAWWLGLVVGIFEVLLGFWAAGRVDRSLYTLIVLVAAIALARGITDIIMGFHARKLAQEPPVAVGAAPWDGPTGADVPGSADGLGDDAGVRAPNGVPSGRGTGGVRPA
jgi:uncharacterized membrane protein HdeD (DUF308 family)